MLWLALLFQATDHPALALVCLAIVMALVLLLVFGLIAHA